VSLVNRIFIRLAGQVTTLYVPWFVFVSFSLLCNCRDEKGTISSPIVGSGRTLCIYDY
jgi:hypothetical protein